METNTIIGMVGTACIAFSLLFILAVGLVTIVKKAKRMYQAGTENYITSAEAKVIKENQVALNDKLNKIKSNTKKE
jgi:hypothetical protein